MFGFVRNFVDKTVNVRYNVHKIVFHFCLLTVNHRVFGKPENLRLSKKSVNRKQKNINSFFCNNQIYCSSNNFPFQNNIIAIEKH